MEANNVELLVEKNFYLCFHHVERWKHVVDQDEALSIAMKGLLYAAESYNPSSGAPFEAYAHMKMKFAFTDYFEFINVKKRKHSPHVSLELESELPESEGSQLLDRLEDESVKSPFCEVEYNEKFRLFEIFVLELSERERSFLEVRQDKTLKETGEVFGFSESRACQLEKSITEKLRSKVIRFHNRELHRIAA